MLKSAKEIPTPAILLCSLILKGPEQNLKGEESVKSISGLPAAGLWSLPEASQEKSSFVPQALGVFFSPGDHFLHKFLKVRVFPLMGTGRRGLFLLQMRPRGQEGEDMLCNDSDPQELACQVM